MADVDPGVAVAVPADHQPERRQRHSRTLPKARAVVSYVCIAANSITAGSIFTFPLFGPSLTSDLGFSLTETNAVWSGAVLGQYAVAGFCGGIADRWGGRVLSLVAAVLFLAGYSLMSRGYSIDAAVHGQFSSPRPVLGVGDEPTTSPPLRQETGFVWMAIYFVFVGIGTCASYFSALTTSTLSFPSSPGLAIAIPLTLFSLSSLFLSGIADFFFVDQRSGDLDTTAFLSFLGLFLFSVNLVGAWGLRVLPSEDVDEVKEDEGHARSLPSDEQTPLLPSSHPSSHSTPGPSSDDEPLRAFLCAPSTLVLLFLLFVAVGASEMVMSSVGSIVVSLLGDQGKATSSPSTTSGVVHTAAKLMATAQGNPLGGKAMNIRSRQVQSIAVANTLSRLLAGALSDVLSPSRPLRPPSFGSASTSLSRLRFRISNIRVSRLFFLFSAVALLTLTFAWSAAYLSTTSRLPLLSVPVGIGYGFVFCLVPALTASLYRKEHFGRNWGTLSYANAVGSFAFSMLFGAIHDRVAKRQQASGAETVVCTAGRACFAPTFAISSGGLAVAGLAVLWLWSRLRKIV